MIKLDVEEWLRKVDPRWVKYALVLEVNNYNTMTAIKTLTHDKLKKMGFKLCPRLMIMKKIEDIKKIEKK